MACSRPVDGTFSLGFVGTVATLLFVPVVFSLLHRQAAGTAKAEPKENVPSTVLEEAVSAT